MTIYAHIMVLGGVRGCEVVQTVMEINNDKHLMACTTLHNLKKVVQVGLLLEKAQKMFENGCARLCKPWFCWGIFVRIFRRLCKEKKNAREID